MGALESFLETYFLCLVSGTVHGIAPDLQFEHGAPCSTTSQRTFRDRHTWHAFAALRFIGCPFALRPNLLAFRFEVGGVAIWVALSGPAEIMSAGMICRGIIIISDVEGNCPSLIRGYHRCNVHIHLIPSIETKFKRL